MAVKRSQSAARVLSAFELIARHQPIGVTALAGLLDADKSATQRALMTLADRNWIGIAPGAPVRWELTPHVLTLAHLPSSTNDLRRRAHPALEVLRGLTEETVYLMVPHERRFVVVEALESHHVLRSAPPIGMVAPARESSTGRAVLPYLAPAEQAEWLGAPADEDLRAEFAATRARGYAVSDGDIVPGSVALASAIFAQDGRPVGAVVVSGPSARVTGDTRTRFGRAIAGTAGELSLGRPRVEDIAL